MVLSLEVSSPENSESAKATIVNDKIAVRHSMKHIIFRIFFMILPPIIFSFIAIFPLAPCKNNSICPNKLVLKYFYFSFVELKRVIKIIKQKFSLHLIT